MKVYNQMDKSFIETSGYRRICFELDLTDASIAQGEKFLKDDTITTIDRLFINQKLSELYTYKKELKKRFDEIIELLPFRVIEMLLKHNF